MPSPESWFAFRAHHKTTIFGFGSDMQAFRCENLLNLDRRHNLYVVSPLTQAELIDFHLDRAKAGCTSIDLDCRISGLVGLVVSDPMSI